MIVFTPKVLLRRMKEANRVSFLEKIREARQRGDKDAIWRLFQEVWESDAVQEMNFTDFRNLFQSPHIAQDATALVLRKQNVRQSLSKAALIYFRDAVPGF